MNKLTENKCYISNPVVFLPASFGSDMSTVPKTDCGLCQWKLNEIYRHRVKVSKCPFLCSQCHSLRSAITQHGKEHCCVCQESAANKANCGPAVAATVLAWRMVQGILFCLLCSAAERYLLKDATLFNQPRVPWCDKCRIIAERVKERQGCLAEELYFNPLMPIPQGYYLYHDTNKCPNCILYKFLTSHPHTIPVNSIFYRS